MLTRFRIICLLVDICKYVLYGGFNMSEAEISKAAKTLSKLGASKGGKARAESLTPEQRTDIAKVAAATRWGVPEAIVDGNLRINGAVIPCAVFDKYYQPRRVITENIIPNALLSASM